MPNNISVVILAAGKGTRMHSSTPKVLHTISGKQMLYYSIRSAKELSDDVIVVVAHQKEAVIDAMSRHFDDLTFVEQDTINYAGTGGALRDVKPKYERVLVLNGDMPLVDPASLKGFVQSSSSVVMSYFELDDPSGYGRVIIDGGGVKKIVEQKDASANELGIKSVNAGVYMFATSLLQKYIPLLSNNNAQGEYYLTDLISMAVDDGIKVEPLEVSKTHFRGVNSKLDLGVAEEIMQEMIRSRLMTQGVSMQLPSTIYIEDGVVFEGECMLENGVRITSGSKIVSSHIKAHSVIEDSIIINSDIGPLAHIRPASHIENSHIGNFVEVKKSHLDGVKAGHLSYIGDANVGSGTNIGAGVITCNYDGKAKHKTTIGKNVFIGSDSQLVAPIVVEDDVMIAAGTTVTSGTIKSGSLALSRVKLEQKEGFFHRFFRKP